MRAFAHLQAIEGDEVDLDAEAWAKARMPDPLRGAFGKLPCAVPRPPASTPANRSRRTRVSAPLRPQPRASPSLDPAPPNRLAVRLH